MLSVHDLHVEVEGKEILCGLDLEVAAGEVHALMGPNGSGKSTLCHVLAGRPGYEVTAGSVTYNGADLLAMEPEVRAREGVFLAFQYPVEIPGVTSLYFLKAALDAQSKHRGEEPLEPLAFLRRVRAQAKLVGLDESLLNRALNVGFSGGEKKRNEIFQLLIMQPALALLDETDSGLDIDALRIVAEGINHVRGEGRAILVITHYQRLLDHIVPDRVHVLADGAIVRSGDKSLALRLETEGYGWLESEAGQ